MQTKQQELNKILLTLKKLKAHEESAHKIGSEAEAQVFAKKIQTLLLQYKLEMSDIEYAKEKEQNPIEKEGIDFSSYGIKVTSKRCAWTERLASIIAEHNACRTLVLRKSNKIFLVGRDPGRSVANYLIGTLTRFCQEQADWYYKKLYYIAKKQGQTEKLKGFKSGFYLGFVDKIRERLKEAATPFKRAENCSALMRIKSEADEVTNFVNGTFRRINSISGRQGSSAGFKSGQQIGAKANINSNGLNSGNGGGLLK